ncbi:hypothetical protein D3C71_522340 [compost metagenome]
MAPWIGFHSVIDRPDSVSRVAPPTRTRQTSVKSTTRSQMRSRRRSFSCFCRAASTTISAEPFAIVMPLERIFQVSLIQSC